MQYQLSRKILCTDDEANFLQGIKRLLRKKFDIVTAVGGQAGLQALEEQGPFAVVVSDYCMPGMMGIEFLKKAHEISPHSVLMMLTGRANLDVAVTALHEGHIFRFLRKPCSAELLTKAIEDSLEQYRLIMMERILTDELNCANDKLRILNEELEDHVAARTSTIQRMHQFVSDLNGLGSLNDVANLIVSATAEMLESRRVSLMLPDATREHLTIAAAVGIPDSVKATIRVPMDAPIAGTVFSQSKSVVVNDPNILANHRDRYDTDFFASAPLISTYLATSTGAVGVLNVTDKIGHGCYDEEALATLKAITEAAAIAIQNQVRFEERNEARDAIILALAKLAEHRDPETGVHLERVQNYCRLLCETLAIKPKYTSVIDKAFIENIVRSSPLHDIGKVGIPDHILLKPGRLTPDEFDIMKNHSKIGGDTIRALIEKGRNQTFLKMGMEIAYYHHEKLDGSGYPYGLAGEAIPLPARILALADVYDALTTHRVYKKAMPHEKAASIIRDEVGSHFDPNVVEAFFQREDEFKTLACELADTCCNQPRHVSNQATQRPSDHAVAAMLAPSHEPENNAS